MDDAELYQQALQLPDKPQYAEACLQKAIALKPERYEAYERLIRLYLSQNKGQAALDVALESVRYCPQNAFAHFQLGYIYHIYRHVAFAVAAYETALKLDPTLAEAYEKLADVFVLMGQYEKALQTYDKSMQVQFSARAAYKKATLLPSIYQSKEDIAFWRKRFIEGLDAFSQQTISFSDPVKEIGTTPFYLAYQGENDCQIQRQMAQNFEAAFPKTILLAPHHSKPKIGFVSRFLRPNHTIGRLFLGILERLSRQQFEIVLFAIAADEVSPLKAPHRYIPLPARDNLVQMRDRIAQEQLDILVYPEIGMCPYTYFLAFNRLAPVQCASFGHPVTTGISTIDYFLSARMWEKATAQAEHYTETLVLLENFPLWYQRPEILGHSYHPGDFGLPEAATLYVCPQLLFKLHPDFDDVLRGILDGDPNGLVVLLNPLTPEIEAQLIQRFQHTLSDVLTRVRILPQLTHQQFLGLLSVADVMLDPLHFGGGNTSLEAFAFGTPVITCPSELLRCRLTQGFYQKMRLMDCVVQTPQEYVQLALQLGQNPSFRQEMREKILKASGVLYENAAIIAELEGFFLDALVRV